MGSKASGIEGHVRGWHIGARVSCYVGDDGRDHVRISLTGGSSGSSESIFLGDFSEKDRARLRAVRSRREKAQEKRRQARTENRIAADFTPEQV